MPDSARTPASAPAEWNLSPEVRARYGRDGLVTIEGARMTITLGQPYRTPMRGLLAARDFCRDKGLIPKPRSART